jgi:SPASM domain peptide maturase of grasp-with-spasm system
MKDMYYKFYESCVPIIGANRGAIYDLTRGNLYFLPAQVLNEFLIYSSLGVEKFYSDYKENQITLKKYFNYFLSNELIFFPENQSRFPKIDTSIIKPYSIDVLILEIDGVNFFKKKLLDINKINELGFTNVVLINNNNSYSNLRLILKELKETKVTNITLMIKYENNVSIKINDSIKNSNQLNEIIIFETPVENNESLNNVIYTKETLYELFHKRINNINDFILNQSAYFESLEKNLYYNRKVYIDKNANIKHNFGDKIKYGNLKTDTLENIILKNNFLELWGISKDLIEVCKDCEFRYICPDRRIPLKRKNKNYYHESSCNYDPYKNEWIQK